MSMPVRFCVYAVCRNLRLFEPFAVLFLLLGMGLPIAQVGLLLGYQRLVWAILEIPGGLVTDRWGRRHALILSFAVNLLSFGLLGFCEQMHSHIAWVIVGLTLMGIGESLRSGTHKAMMLHWAELNNKQDTIDEIMAVARLCSKVTSGIAAIVGGLLLWWTGTFAMLFYFSALVCFAGMGLIASYPRVLDQSFEKVPTRDDQKQAPVSWVKRLSQLGTPGLGAMLISSILFESQIKVAIAYLQPYLANGFHRSDVAVVGGIGGLGIGLYFLVQDTLAGLCATQGKKLKKRCKGVVAANAVIYAVACGVMLIAVMSLWMEWRWLGLGAMICLAGLQNLRRPLLVTGMDTFMQPQWRATTLSVESLGRCVLYSISVSIGGFLAQWDALRSVYLLLLGLMLVGLIPLVKTLITHRNHPYLS
jgi:MFS family permease